MHRTALAANAGCFVYYLSLAVVLGAKHLFGAQRHANTAGFAGVFIK